jgi:hypothetical protein
LCLLFVTPSQPFFSLHSAPPSLPFFIINNNNSEATKRDDMLFIGSTGNNGTDRSQWLNYPSAYAGVVAVGAVNCRNEVQPWSQKNARVDVVAPGAGFWGGALCSCAVAFGFTRLALA